MKGRWIAIAIAVLACGTLALVASGQLMPRGFGDGVRRVDQGGQFGVRIGMSRADARRVLEKHWNIRFRSAYACQHPGFYDTDCDGAQVKDSYEASGDPMGGVIDLYICDGKVMRIEWWRHPFDP